MQPNKEHWRLGRNAMVGSLIVAHIWGTALVIAALMGRESSILSDMFDTIGFMIFTTLAVLVGGKAWKEFAPIKWSKDK